MNKDKKLNTFLRMVETAVDRDRVSSHLMPPDDNDPDSLVSGYQPYFRKFGIKVPKWYQEVYEKAGAPMSDKYISASLYFYYIYPTLVNLNLAYAYVDKNFYGRLFPDIAQPKTTLSRISGKFVTPPVQK